MLRGLPGIFATTLMFACSAHAADVEVWKYRGEIAWNHPDGRTIDGHYTQTRVDDDLLRIIRDSRTGRYFMEMKLTGNGQLLDRAAHIFFLDKPDLKNARKVHTFDGDVWPGSGNLTGSIVAELNAADLAAVKTYSGNLMGGTYVARTSADGPDGRWRTYYMLGDNIAEAAEVLVSLAAPAPRKPVETSGLTPAQKSAIWGAPEGGVSGKWVMIDPSGFGNGRPASPTPTESQSFDQWVYE